MRTKKRSLGELLDKITMVDRIKRKFYTAKWQPWLQKAQGLFCGYIDSFTEEACIFRVDKETYSIRVASTPRERVLVVEDKALPLIGGPPLYDIDTIEKRLKGTEAGYSYRQNLVDEYCQIELRTNHQNKFREFCLREIFKLLDEKLLKEKEIRLTIVIILKRKRKVFNIYRQTDNSYRFFTESEIISYNCP